MLFEKAKPEDFSRIKQFYWSLIDEMYDQNDKIGWKKDIYPTDFFCRKVWAEKNFLCLMHWLFLLHCRGKESENILWVRSWNLRKKKKTVRLDILGTNTAAEKLYTGCGFHFVQAKDMFYEDTGWTEYKMYERIL